MITQRQFASGQAGFTLIELMITITIVSILTLFAMPSYKTWIANSRVRTTTEAIQNGLMLAKAQALSRNAKVQFVLTNTSPVVSQVNNVPNTAPEGTVSGWMVRVYQATTYNPADFIQGRSVAEGGVNTTTTVSPWTSAFVFNGVGGVFTGSPLAIPANTEINVSGTGSDRPLRIKISKGGAIRMCDPNTAVATTSIGC